MKKDEKTKRSVEGNNETENMSDYGRNGGSEEGFKLQLVGPPPISMWQWVTRLPLHNVQNDFLDPTKSILYLYKASKKTLGTNSTISKNIVRLMCHFPIKLQ